MIYFWYLLTHFVFFFLFFYFLYYSKCYLNSFIPDCPVTHYCTNWTNKYLLLYVPCHKIFGNFVNYCFVSFRLKKNNGSRYNLISLVKFNRMRFSFLSKKIIYLFHIGFMNFCEWRLRRRLSCELQITVNTSFPSDYNSIILLHPTIYINTLIDFMYSGAKSDFTPTALTPIIRAYPWIKTNCFWISTWVVSEFFLPHVLK